MANQQDFSTVWEITDNLWQRIESILMGEGKATEHKAEGGKRRDILVIKDPYYIAASAPLADTQDRVLKHGESFAVFDHYGDIMATGMGEEGIFHQGTRFLSSLLLQLGEQRPLFLSSTVKKDNAILTVDLTNPDIYDADDILISKGTLHIFRSKFLWQGCCYERIHVRNFGEQTIEAHFSLHYRTDFADIFEVRGTRRERKGEMQPPQVDKKGSVLLSYRGLDDVVRATKLTFSPKPDAISDTAMHFTIALEPKGEADYYFTVACQIDDEPRRSKSYESAAASAMAALHTAREHYCQIYTSNEQFNDWLNRSLADIQLMTTDTEHGPYPYAGVPWFSTAFGRDGILTALQCLWINPHLAKGVLKYLAATQADALIPEQDAEPGKILHETRDGEMASLGEIPFGRYYGSVDSTPLFVLLAGAYHEATGDRDFIDSIWPNIERALHWIDTYGDADGDGLVEYHRKSATGLVQQGWKDSHDSVFHADGKMAETPIALCEVQGYVYAAKRYAAEMASLLGRQELAVKLAGEAQTLRERFEQLFWCEDLGCYALALDGNKRPCRVVSSNAGQCLLSYIARPDRAQRTAQTLLADDIFSGWGIRTLSSKEVRYNPMSYHNGSIWPHDNALIAQGFANYHQKDAVLRMLAGLFDASLFVELQRMPELFCGFPRREHEGPTRYPVACAPQSWAAACVFMLLGSALGLRVFGAQGRVSFVYPLLPEFLKEVQIIGLRVGAAVVDLQLIRHTRDVGVNVLRREGDVEVVVVK